MNFDDEDNLDSQLNKIASIVIKEKRIKKGYSLEELANKLNKIVTRQSLYRYENNEARMKNKIFKRICEALNENPNDVWNEINNRFLKSLGIEDKQVSTINEYDKQIKKISTDNGVEISYAKEKPITAEDVIDVNKVLMEELNKEKDDK